jgi:hypothetical protein
MPNASVVQVKCPVRRDENRIERHLNSTKRQEITCRFFVVHLFLFMYRGQSPSRVQAQRKSTASSPVHFAGRIVALSFKEFSVAPPADNLC